MRAVKRTVGWTLLEGVGFGLGGCGVCCGGDRERIKKGLTPYRIS